MITFITAVLGFVTSLLPSLIKFWETRTELKYRIELEKIRIEALARGINLQHDTINANLAIAEGQSARNHDIQLGGGGFMEAFRASVRPTLTYLFFFLFCAIKLIALFTLISMGKNPVDIVNAVWDIYTASTFGTIIGFWFGARASEKFQGTTSLLRKG